MTKEKAIELLNEIIEEGWLISDLEKCPAIDACEMAIEALEQEPILDKVKEVVAKWKVDNFTDGYAWDCMKEIANIVDKAESEE